MTSKLLLAWSEGVAATGWIRVPARRPGSHAAGSRAGSTHDNDVVASPCGVHPQGSADTRSAYVDDEAADED